VTPPAHHFEAARACLAAGIHVLVEKPVTATVAEAEILVALARTHGCVFQVGHLERFNPAVLAVRRHLTQPQRIEARRLSKFQTRGTEVDVVLDLMIHDIDIVLSMVTAPLERLHASGSVVISGDIDVAHASVYFADGCVAELTASRVNREPARSMEIFQPGACISVDYLNHTLLVSEAGGTSTAPTMSFAEESLVRTDVLMDEIRAFVAAVVRGEAPPVSGEDGKRALEVAVAISQEIRRQGTVVQTARR
jgi:predicted dehydrogenase